MGTECLVAEEVKLPLHKAALSGSWTGIWPMKILLFPSRAFELPSPTILAILGGFRIGGGSIIRLVTRPPPTTWLGCGLRCGLNCESNKGDDQNGDGGFRRCGGHVDEIYRISGRHSSDLRSTATLPQASLSGRCDFCASVSILGVCAPAARPPPPDCRSIQRVCAEAVLCCVRSCVMSDDSAEASR